MATKSKLELVMELGDKLFNNKLAQVSAKLGMASDKMQSKLDKLKMPKLETDGVEKLSSLNFGIGAGIGMEVVDTAISGISDLSTEAINSVDALTKFEDTMRFAGFDTKAIDIARTAVKKYANDTVYDLTTISNTTAQLAANGIEDYNGLTQAAGNLNAVAGGNADTFKSVSMALTQTAGAGKLTTENWNQLANAIPGASGKLQEAMLKNGAFTGNFREAMEKGNITAHEFNKALMDLGTDPIAVEAAKSTKTFEGAIGQMKAGVVDTFANILTAIGIDNLTGAITTMGTVIQTVLHPFVWFFTELKKGNPVLQILVSIIGAITVGFLAYQVVIGALSLPLKLAAAAQTLLNLAMTANPIGLIIAGIAALIALIVIIIKKWDEWGAALTLFMGPIGLIIGAFKSVYDHWESIKTAFQTEGIVGGLKRIGIVLLDAILKPLQQILELVAKVDPTGLAQKGVDSIKAFRESQNLVTPGEKEARAVKTVTPTDKAPKSPLLKAPVIDGKLAPTGKTKKEGEQVSKVAGQANQIRKIDIRIDSFNKGGINVAQGAYAGMTKEDVEAWFKEMMRRVVINAETA